MSSGGPARPRRARPTAAAGSAASTKPGKPGKPGKPAERTNQAERADTAGALDSESRTSPGDHQALRLWLRLLACVNLVEVPLRQRLRADFGVSLPRFDLLAQLDRHPGGLRMRELSRRLMVTGGNVTGLSDRLVAEGLVERLDSVDDGRATTLRLTAAGQRQFDAMAQVHERWVAELLGGLDAREQSQLFGLLGALKRSRSDAPTR